MKKLIFSLSLCLFSLSVVTAQQLYSVGGHASYILGGAISNLGIHGNAEFDIDDRTSIIGHIGLFVPSSYSGETSMYARNSSLSPSSITVGYTNTIGGFQLGVDGKYYFKGELGDDFAFYGNAGLGLLSFGLKSKLDDRYDSRYGSFSKEDWEAKERLSNFVIVAGIGIEVGLGRDLMLFAEPRLNFPANDVGGSYVEINIPTTLQLNVGLRFLP